MFTGIVRGLGRVASVTPLAGEFRLAVEADFDWDGPLEIGESISVSGVCLTVTAGSGRWFTAHVSAETISRTVMKTFKPGDRVNLERALKLSDRLGGHLVAGHVDGVGRIADKREKDRSLVFSFSHDPALSPLLIEKGSIAIDGVSLTVNRVLPAGFTINVIPHTAVLTTLGFKKAGDYVNLETDLIGKYVARLLGKGGSGSGIDANFLAEHGFL